MDATTSLVAAHGPFDLILCSDCVYVDSTNLSRLVHTIQVLLSAPQRPGAGPAAERRGGGAAGAAAQLETGCQALVAFEVRPGVQRFASLLREYGIRAVEVPESQLDPDWTSPDILVWQVFLPAAHAGPTEPAASGISHT